MDDASSGGGGEASEVCPCCSSMYAVVVKQRSIGRSAFAAATCLYAGFATYLDGIRGNIITCRPCYDVAVEVTKLLRFAFVTSPYFHSAGRSSKAVKAAAPFKVGDMTLRGALDDIARGGMTSLNIGNLPTMDQVFEAGTLVTVASRMGPGVNKPGGSAVVEACHHGLGSPTYDVKYVVGNSKEKALPANLLRPFVGTQGPRRGSSGTSSASADSRMAAGEERSAIEGQALSITQLEKRLAAVEWERDKARGVASKVRRRLVEASKEASSMKKDMKKASEALERERVLRQVDEERANATFDEALEAAAQAAAADARDLLVANFSALRKEKQQQQRESNRRIQELEHALRVQEAARVRVESSVLRLLDDAVDSAVQEKEAEHQVAVNGLQAQLDAKEKEVATARESLRGVAAVLGVVIPARLSVNTGIRSGSVKEMSAKEKCIVAKTAAACILKVLQISKAGDGNAEHIGELIQEHGGLEGYGLGASSAVLKELGILRTLMSNVKGSFKIYSLQKNTAMSKMLLSLVAPVDNIASVIKLMSNFIPVELGKLVTVHSSAQLNLRRAKLEGVVRYIDMEAGTCAIDVWKRKDAETKRRWVTLAQEAEEVFEQMEQTGVSITVSLGNVSVVGSVRVTEGQVKAARAQAAEHYPGHLLLHELGQHHRVRKSITHYDVMNKHYDSEEMFPLRHSSAHGPLWLRALSIRESWKLACKACVDAGCEKPRWEDYLHVLSSADYKRQVPLNCVCSYCRILGLETFDELVDLLSYLATPKELSDEYKERAGWLRTELCVNYAGKLREQSPSAWHCIRFGLTTSNFKPFHEACSHGYDDTGAKHNAEPTMDELARGAVAAGGRGQQHATPDCWNNDCWRCMKPGGKVSLCNNCAEVGCMDCIERTRDDVDKGITSKADEVAAKAHGGGLARSWNKAKVPKAKADANPMCPTGWRCDACEAENSAVDHYAEDIAMDELHHLFKEVDNAVNLWGIKDGHVRDIPIVVDEDDDEEDGDYVSGDENDVSEDEEDDEEFEEEGDTEIDSEGSEGESDDAEMAAAASGETQERLRPRVPEAVKLQEQARDGARARLRHILRNLAKLRAHKMRTVKLRKLRKEQLENLDSYTVMEWKDYMGKLEARKSMQGTSENLGRKLSLHGSLFIMKNPCADIRSEYSEVDWSMFPAADDDCLVQVNMYGAADEAKQSAFHMGSVMSVQYRAMKAAFPWLTSAIPYSDQCGDYRSTAATIFNHEMGRLTGLKVKLVMHSEVGEGKGEVDMRFGQKAQQFVAILGRLPRTCAAQLFEHLELCRGAGDYNLQLDISLALFKAGSLGALPYLEQCASVEYPEGGGVVLREVHGYGPGVAVTKEELVKLDHYGLMAAAETGSVALQTSDGPMKVQRRDRDNAKRQAAGDRQNLQKEKGMQREEEKQKKADLMAAVEPKSSVRDCGACGAKYRTEATFEHHFANGMCERRKTAKADVQAPRPERKAATVVVEERRAAHAAVQATGAQRIFEFASHADGMGVELAADAEGTVVVEAVSRDHTILAAKVLPSYTVKAVSVSDAAVESWTAASLKDLLRESSVARPVKVTFGKPPGPMPMRGWARKRARKESPMKVTETQAHFLAAFCDAREEEHSQPRAHAVREAMILKFGGLAVDPDTKEPIVMTETAIFNWLKTRWSAKKVVLVHISAAAAMRAATGKEAGGGTEATESEDDEE